MTATLQEFSERFDLELQKNFKSAFGPNWLFHVEMELKTRDPDYVFIDEYPEPQQPAKIKEVTALIMLLSDALLFCDDIKNSSVESTFYNWHPEVRLTHLIDEHPDWEIHTIPSIYGDGDGGVTIIGVGDIRVIRDTFEKRLELWQTAVAELNSELAESTAGGHLCNICFELHVKSKYYTAPPQPKLERQSGVRTRVNRSELYPVFCQFCGKKDVTIIQF